MPRAPRKGRKRRGQLTRPVGPIVDDPIRDLVRQYAPPRPPPQDADDMKWSQRMLRLGDVIEPRELVDRTHIRPVPERRRIEIHLPDVNSLYPSPALSFQSAQLHVAVLAANRLFHQLVESTFRMPPRTAHALHQTVGPILQQPPRDDVLRTVLASGHRDRDIWIRGDELYRRPILNYSGVPRPVRNPPQNPQDPNDM